MTNLDQPPAPKPLTNRIVGLGDVGDVRTWLTVAIVIGFFAVYGLNWYRGDTKALDLMNGALIAAFTGVIGYWMGSSRSSDAKNAVIGTLAAQADPEKKDGLV